MTEVVPVNRSNIIRYQIKSNQVTGDVIDKLESILSLDMTSPDQINDNYDSGSEFMGQKFQELNGLCEEYGVFFYVNSAFSSIFGDESLSNILYQESNTSEGDGFMVGEFGYIIPDNQSKIVLRKRDTVKLAKRIGDKLNEYKKQIDFQRDRNKLMKQSVVIYENTLHNSLHDRLTSLPNRPGMEVFEDGIITDIESGKETGDVLVIMLDLDRFKRYNDTVNHDLGDRILIGFADTIRSFASGISGSDNIGLSRLGGEEFKMVIRGFKGDPEEFLERFRIFIERARYEISVRVHKAIMLKEIYRQNKVAERKQLQHQLSNMITESKDSKLLELSNEGQISLEDVRKLIRSTADDALSQADSLPDLPPEIIDPALRGIDTISDIPYLRVTASIGAILIPFEQLKLSVAKKEGKEIFAQANTLADDNSMVSKNAGRNRVKFSTFLNDSSQANRSVEPDQVVSRRRDSA